MVREKILVAMSGGVDSSVAALLLKRNGYECHGVTMKLQSENDPILAGGVSCSAPSELQDAANVAERLQIPFSVYDLSADFRRHVIDYFIQTYLEGGTPNPCVQCNRTMKFGKLLSIADELGCQKIATGHYARIQKNANGRYLLSAADDSAKDQTYVLWQLKQEQLARICFPLSDLSKDEVRAYAEQFGFCNAQKRDSQDICFVPDGDYVSLIERVLGTPFPRGIFTDLSGNRLGEHDGMIRYTIGQRKGLGIAFGKPTYVCAKDAATNTVVLGSNEDLFSSVLTARSVNLIATERLDAPIRVMAKVRYRATPAPAVVEQIDDDRISVVFDQPQRAISKGQSVVLYDGNTVIGGGIIE